MVEWVGVAVFGSQFVIRCLLFVSCQCFFGTSFRWRRKTRCHRTVPNPEFANLNSPITNDKQSMTFPTKVVIGRNCRTDAFVRSAMSLRISLERTKASVLRGLLSETSSMTNLQFASSPLRHGLSRVLRLISNRICFSSSSSRSDVSSRCCMTAVVEPPKTRSTTSCSIDLVALVS